MNFFLLVELTKRDFVDRYSGSVLGVFWSFIWPLVSVFIYIVIFSQVMSARLPGISYNYGIYLVAGLLPWTAFASTLSRTSTIFVDKKHIISKVHVSLSSLPIYIVMSESITFLLTLSIYVLFLLAVHAPLNGSLIFLPFVYLVQQIFAYSLGFLIAVFHTFLRDLKEFTGIILQIWFWFTPIVYVSDILPDNLRGYLFLNPAFLFVEAYHDIFVFARLPNFIHLMALTFLGHGLWITAYLIFKKLEKDIRDFL